MASDLMEIEEIYFTDDVVGAVAVISHCAAPMPVAAPLVDIRIRNKKHNTRVTMGLT